MQYIIEHYGKVIVIVVGIIAALCITAALITTANKGSKSEVSNIKTDGYYNSAELKSSTVPD